MDKWQHYFSFTQEDVNDFAKLTGDTNPIHLDEKYASKSIFGKRVVHGALSNSVFSKVFGTIKPGEGAIYLSQDTSFLAPMYVDLEYVATFEEVNRTEKGIVTIETQIKEKSTNKLTVNGKAVLKIKI